MQMFISSSRNIDYVRLISGTGKTKMLYVNNLLFIEKIAFLYLLLEEQIRDSLWHWLINLKKTDFYIDLMALQYKM